VNAVNDESLPTNISDDVQQTSGTYKNFLFIFSAHMCTCLFAPVENSVMPVTKKSFEERAATVFDKKVAKLFDNVDNQLFNKLNIYLESSCFYFPQTPWKMCMFVLNDLFEDIKHFLERASNSDQIKSSRLCFSP